MKIKNINALERHVEKALVVLAVLFLAWMCYRNLVEDPNAVALPGSGFVTVPPGRVGQEISRAVLHLKRTVKAAEGSRAMQRGVIPDYERIYTLSQIQPLAATLVQLPAIAVGPLNHGLQTTANPVERTLVFAVPRVPRLTDLKATQGRGVAAIAPKPQDMTWVELRASFPLARWHKSMADGSHLKANEAPLPRSFRRTIFYRIQVRRRQRLPSGRWGLWVAVKGTYLQALPRINLANATAGRVAAALGILDQSQSQIVTPAFYPMEAQRHLVAPGIQPQVPRGPPQGPGGAPQFPPQLRPPMGGAFNNGGRMGAGAAQAARARMIQAQQMRMQRQRMQQQQRRQFPQNNFPNPNFAPNVPPMGGVPGTTATATSIPVNFYDQTALPGEQYRYEMRVVLYNPVFEFPYNLTDPNAKGQPWLMSAWSKPTRPVKIRRSEYFFLVSSQSDSRGRASFRIFKWVHGIWTVADEWVAPGQGIGNTQQVPLINNVNGNLENTAVNFATGYKLVDAKENSAGSSLTIIIEHPNGALSMRTSAWDAVDPQQSRLNSRVAQTGIAPTPPVPARPVP